MKNKPFVSVTGLVSVGEIDFVVKQFSNSYAKVSSHKPAIGFLVSEQTLKGENHQNLRFPKLDNFAEVLLARVPYNIENVIHYKTKNPATIADDVSKLFTDFCDGSVCRVVQLNMPFNETDQLKILKDNNPTLSIALKIPNYDIKLREIADKVCAYCDSISYAMIELPEKRQQQNGVQTQLDLYKELASRCSNVTLGFTGGFSAWNVEDKVQDIIARVGTKDFCIDAVSGLRDKISDKKDDDVLDHKRVREYLKSVALVLK